MAIVAANRYQLCVAFCAAGSTAVLMGAAIWLSQNANAGHADLAGKSFNPTVAPSVEAPIPAIQELRSTLQDPKRSETDRNQAIDSLRLLDATPLSATLACMLTDQKESIRMRSYAAQHLGIAWEQSGFQPGAMERAALWTAAQDGPTDIRREALLALTRGSDAKAISLAGTLLHDPAATWFHDLGCRIAGLTGHTDWMPRIRELLTCDDAFTVRQATWALERLSATRASIRQSATRAAHGMTPW